MKNQEMNLFSKIHTSIGWCFCYLMFISILLTSSSTSVLATTKSNSKHGQVCNAVDLSLPSSCGKNERCQLSRDETSGICTCNRGFIYRNQECFQAPSTENPTASTYTGKPAVKPTSGGSLGLFLIIPSLFALLGIVGYFGARRYKLLQKLQQLRQNRYGSVLVTRDDTDDDDPPLA